MQFYILMIRYHDLRSSEAVVNPEMTRRQVISEVRDIENDPRRSLEFVKFVDGNFIEDITFDIAEEASQLEAA